MRGGLGLVVGGLVVAFSTAAAAQSSTQIKPRVLIMVDTSGSMTEHFTDNYSTGGDGSTFFSDKVMTRSQASNFDNGLYPGYATSAVCPGSSTTTYDGVNSRMYAAKQAVTNIIAGSGDIDWGLMRYTGTTCSVVDTFTQGNTNCSSDDRCPVGQFCISGKCSTDDNLCNTYGFTFTGGSAGYGATRTSGGTCQNRLGSNGNALTYSGTCGTTVSSSPGSLDPACATPQVCYSDADCNNGTAGSCVALSGSAAKVCKCGSGGATCDGTVYTCSSNICVYAEGCQSPGGTILVDPTTANASSQVLPYVDGVEALPGNVAGIAVNPELRAVGGTPLAGAARSATAWYKNIVTTNADPKIACRPYVLVQMTDGFDQCDADQTNGPVAAAASFVAATAPAAKTLNKVYVVGLAFGTNSNPTLDAIAKAGGTGQARLANSQADIQAALADIVSSSVLHEICNNRDDNCDGQCDENFPDVGVTPAPGETCPSRTAKSCNNGFPSNTACFDQGTYQCSADGLSEVCNAQTCQGGNGGSLSVPVAGTMRITSTGPINIAASAVGSLLWVQNAGNAADNGVFTITAVGTNSVDVSNAGAVATTNTVGYGVPTMQGNATINVVAGGNETLTVSSTAGVKPGDTIYVVGAANANYNGTFTVTSVPSATTIVVPAKATATTGSGSGLWLDPRVCVGVEICDGLDNDCDGIIDNCGDTISGSCCKSQCPPCAKPPYIELCNNCDDDCNGIIDDNPKDVGVACGNNVGDCAPGVTECCQQDPNSSGGACTQSQTGTGDTIYCAGGNPGYPQPDKCDGTDDNCNGIANDNSARICFTDGVNTLPPADDGVGVCHHGVQACQTVALAPPTLGGDGKYHCLDGTVWPQGKNCPNPTPVYGACSGLVAPQSEVCNGADDDCDGTVDDNLTDPWANPADPSHACCDTGNPADCQNANGSTTCKMGGWMCVGGKKTCVGAVHKTLEICDMIDNDCNGAVDDVPGVNQPCTGNGVNTQGTCTAKLQCVAGNTQPQCVQQTFPVAESCNGLDDNCNGLVDDNGPPLAQNPLPGVGVACDIPMPPADKPPCKAGATVCVPNTTGRCKPGELACLVCDGAVGPMPNQCNGISTDCTGTPNTNGNCPSGYYCYQGNCLAPCGAGEFPCAGGYVCDKNSTTCDSNGAHPGCCVPDVCATKNCPAGDICQIDAQGNGQCVDPCKTVTCPTGYLCKLGACVDASCRTQGCPTGQVCVLDPNTNLPVCADDPCANVTCPDGQFCQDGGCVRACAGPCPPGTFCDKGNCSPDPCAHVPCVEGEVCTVQNGVGVCVPDQCQFGCNLGQACCGGACISDPCATLHCPEDTHCTLDSACQATCETDPAAAKDQIVGAGGGGFGCSVGGHGAAPASAAWLLLAFGLLFGRRRLRRAEVRR